MALYSNIDGITGVDVNFIQLLERESEKQLIILKIMFVWFVG